MLPMNETRRSPHTHHARLGPLKLSPITQLTIASSGTSSPQLLHHPVEPDAAAVH